ncbi:hypothetical protein SAMN02949497_4759 [Methylomagnum ishizawai]|uniref:Uncharacterized protein n=1 Tax=Methylomagnum ishizawai TaxID=1760988 RepID=A0A1Y6DBC3_9GAMM|nr:hypothetical protein [Methylomagnum ishizawai]SMF97903.1 hypothetical protein SAMN02949497_4759 [Methylomagnum ishizawai]
MAEKQIPDMTSDPTNLRTLNQKVHFVVTLLSYPALSIMVFMRRKMGLRQLSSIKLGITALVMFGYSEILPMAGKFTNALARTEESLKYFFPLAVAMVIVGTLQRWQRRRDLKKGKMWHSYSLGLSWFEFLPIRDDLVRLYIDPIACIIIACIVGYTLSPLLANWLIFSTISLVAVEVWTREQQFNALLDMVDNLVESEIRSANTEFFLRNDPTLVASPPPHRNLEETAGIPTGIAPDIEAQIQRRKARKPPPDDLAA